MATGEEYSAPRTAGREFRMLDVAGILFSSAMILIVIVQAVRLDRIQPWFQNVKAQNPPVGQARTRKQRR